MPDVNKLIKVGLDLNSNSIVNVNNVSSLTISVTDELVTTSTTVVGSGVTANKPYINARGLNCEGGTILNGSQTIKMTPTAVDYTVLVTDYLVRVTNTSNPRTITMPDATTCSGQVFIIKDSMGSASVNNITIVGVLSQLFNGAVSLVISGDYNAFTLVSNGVGWEII